jgi:hypothetical protein
MTTLKLIHTPNRRGDRLDRRQSIDRRGPPSPGADTVKVLRDLLDKAHARVRALEHMVETLKKKI